MNPQVDILDVSLFNLAGDFDSQVKDLLDSVRLTRREVERLSDLFNDLQNTLQRAWPGCQVIPFGSIVTGLGIRTSDVDCYVSLPIWVKTSPGATVMKAKQTLAQRQYLFTELSAIPMAKVPIVKFYHIPTSRHCDVNFKSAAGIQNSKLIAYLLHRDDRALPLAIIIKYWSKVHNFTGTNLMPNYALTMLVIFYLQQIHIIPSVFLLQQNVRHKFIDNWNTAFNETSNYKSNNHDSLYQIVGGFFNFYSNFDFQGNIVSPYLGCAISRELFKDVETIPGEFSLYTHNLRCDMCRPLNVDSKICIQDPFEHGRNCSVAVYPKLADKIDKLFKNAAKVFTEDVDDGFLKAILTREPVTARAKKQKAKTPSQMKKRKEHFKNLKQSLHVMYREISKQKRGKR